MVDMLLSVPFDVLLLVALLFSSLLASQRKKLGKPRKNITNLNGFEYRYLNGLKVPY
jgi:hypothetical protein